LDRLQKQLDLLQSLLQPKKGPPFGRGGAGRSLERKYVAKKGAVEVPIDVGASSGGTFEALSATVKEFRFYVSIDGGNSWNLLATAPGTQKAFKFQPPGDGGYLCRIDGVNAAGKMVYTSTGPRLIVDTTPPGIQLVGKRQGDNVTVDWSIDEPNLDRFSLRLEYMKIRDKSWHRLLIGGANDNGSVGFRTENNDPIPVRMFARDLAGHEATREITIPPQPRQ
jgi:hypothetical protein